MQIETLLVELGAKTGLGELTLTENSLALCFDGKHDIVLQRDPTNNALLLHATVLPGSVLCSVPVCRRLLALSLLGVHAQGGAFALHEEEDEVVLWKRHDDNFMDLEALEQAIDSFLAAVVYWKEKLREELGEQVGAPDSVSFDMGADTPLPMGAMKI